MSYGNSSSQRRGGGLTPKGCIALGIMGAFVLVAVGVVIYGLISLVSSNTQTPTQIVLNTQAPASTQAPFTATSVIQDTVAATGTQLAQGTVQPTVTPRATNTPNATAGPNATSQPSANLPTYVVGMDAFAPYYNLALIKQLGLDVLYGFNLELVTFCSTEENCYDEATRSDKLASGEWDGLLTTIDKLALYPAIGQLTAFVDETDGADLIACNSSVVTFNDLRGKRIAFLGESIGEFFAYYVLSIVKITPAEVTLVPTGSVADAAEMVVNNEADCVSGWTPDVDPAVESGRILVDSHTMRIPLDVILTSNQAVEQRPDVVQAFHYAWFAALKLQFEQPDEAEGAVITWFADNGLTDWSYVAAPGDLLGWQETTPQASLSRNRSAMSVLNLVGQRLLEAQRVWAAFNKTVAGLDETGMVARVNPTFVQNAATRSELATTASAVNDSFQFTAASDVAALDPDRDNQETILATLPLEKIPFQPESTRLTDEAKRQLDEFVIPVLRNSPEVYLRLEGSAAWPGGFGYTEADILAFAKLRAQAVADYLVDKGGFDPDRFLVTSVPPQYPQSRSNTELEQDRYVRFVLIALGR